MIFIVLILIGYSYHISAYEKKSLVERYTNSQCGPCASLNSAWYNATTASLLSSKLISHLVYNVNWPSETDPMYLLNSTDNSARWRYYGVNSVPWIVVNGTTISTSSSTNLTSAVSTGNSQFSPFKIILTPVKFSNNVINVHIKIFRDPADVTTFAKTKLKVALTEKTVVVTPALEAAYYSIARKMLPDGKGMAFNIPSPGDSIELDLMYIPTTNFTQAVNFDSIRVVTFIQSDQTKEIYQSAMEDLTISNNINSAFSSDETLGALPFTIHFTDYSTGLNSTNIVSWQWDFDNNGTIDSYEPNPIWTYTTEKSYSVKLSVSDGTNQHTRTLNNMITVLGASSDILVVNGIDYSNTTYKPEMTTFYNSSACFGNHQVDIWDLFGDQEFNYQANSNITKTHLYNRSIPTSVLNLYDKVIWIGNNYSGDLEFYNPTQVLDYVQNGGNFLLATRMASFFFNTELKNYCGITQLSTDQQITQLIALDNSLVNMPVNSAHTYVHYVTLDTSLGAIPIFDDDLGTTWIAGFMIRKQNDGTFIFIAGRPYRYNTSASFANYDYIIDNWLINEPVSINEDINTTPNYYSLSQNYPNPFNPSTKIRYTIKEPGFVSLKVFNLIGEQIANLINEEKQPGEYSINFDGTNISSGIYLYRLQTGNFSSTKKLILLK